MAASKWQVYNEAKKYMLNGTLDLDTNTFVMKVVKAASAALVSNYTRSTFASAGTGVAWKASSTRHALDTLVVTAGGTASTMKFDAADEVFTASAAITAVQYLVIGISNGKALCWSKLSASTNIGAGSTLTVAFNTSGIFTLSGGSTA